jgi:Zn-finger nucleic acid-binding protein
MKPESEFYKLVGKVYNRKVRSYCKECMSLYYKSNKAAHFIAAEKYCVNHPFRQWASSVKSTHKVRGHEIIITLDEIEKLAIETTHCPICGVKLDYGRITKMGKSQMNSPSLDRKDNEKHLSIHNTWIICKECNTTKGSKTFKEFITYCNEVVKKYGNGIN